MRDVPAFSLVTVHDHKMSRITCNMKCVRKDMRSTCIWDACDKTNLTEHPIYRKLTQRIYFMITGMGQNFNDKIRALCERPKNEVFQIYVYSYLFIKHAKKKINFTRTGR